jgi:hypothetical protein
MEGVIDIRTALERLGTGWQFGGSVTANTQEAWDAVDWEDTRPKPSWDDLCAAIKPKLTPVQAAKRAEINAGFDAALTASLTMPSATNPPSAFAVYQAIEAWKTEDPEGYAALLAIHTARRDSLLSAVDAATSVEAVQAIAVTYAV